LSHRELTTGERRQHLVALLKSRNDPIKASDLAKITGVSRQVIVGDIALLRAKNEPILSTPQGYIYTKQENPGIRRVILTRHLPNEMEKELTILVDHGVTVIDVGIEHSVYGRILRPLGLKSRSDVRKFIVEMTKNSAPPLSTLTGGLHFHTVEASSKEDLDEACGELARAGYFVG
jgi:transcriptional regulator of NAD metabolism